MQFYEKQLLDCLELRGLSPRTQYDYLHRLRNIAKYYDSDPTNLTICQIREYFLYLIRVKKLDPQTIKNHYYGLRFFYIHVVGFEESDFKFYKQKIVSKLPVVISTEEISKILSNIKIYDYKVALQLMYSCGLRVSEVISIKVCDIDSNLCMLTIRNSKGNKDRSIPLPNKTLLLLRDYWKTHRNPVYLFPIRTRSKNQDFFSRSKTTKTIRKRTLQYALNNATKLSGINKRVTTHTLRHSYATNLLNIGVNITNLSKYLGHKSLKSTIMYLHMTTASNERAVELINQEMLKF